MNPNDKTNNTIKSYSTEYEVTLEEGYAILESVFGKDFADLWKKELDRGNKNSVYLGNTKFKVGKLCDMVIWRKTDYELFIKNDSLLKELEYINVTTPTPTNSINGLSPNAIFIDEAMPSGTDYESYLKKKKKEEKKLRESNAEAIARANELAKDAKRRLDEEFARLQSGVEF